MLYNCQERAQTHLSFKIILNTVHIKLSLFIKKNINIRKKLLHFEQFFLQDNRHLTAQTE